MMPDILPLSPEGFPESSISADIICKRLEHLSKKRLFSVRKNGNRAEWKGTSGKFCGRLSFPAQHTSCRRSWLTTRRIGDKTVISVSFQDGGKIELIQQKNTLGEKAFPSSDERERVFVNHIFYQLLKNVIYDPFEKCLDGQSEMLVACATCWKSMCQSIRRQKVM